MAGLAEYVQAMGIGHGGATQVMTQWHETNRMDGHERHRWQVVG